MRKNLTFLTVALALAASTLPLSAQVLNSPFNHNLEVKRLQPNQSNRVSNHETMKKNFPLLMQRKMAAPSKSVFSEPLGKVNQRVGGAAQAPKWRATSSYVPTMYSNMLSKDFTGFVSFTPKAVSPVKLLEYSSGVFNAGTTTKNGEMRGMYLNTQLAGWGMIFLYHFSVDLATWEITKQPEAVQDLSLAALETATDPADGTVFGEFYSADLKKFEFGVIDYDNLTRTTIAQVSKQYMALGIAKDGFAYGVALDGNLYKIDRTTGSETLIGATGWELADQDGSGYFQSGEIDPRTNVFYWAATDKDGNSALCTIDLKTGKATKVGELGMGTDFVGMVIPCEMAADKAPDAVTNLAATFNKNELSGTISFTAPLKTFDGTGNLGDLNYHVLAGGEEKTHGTTQAGKAVTANVTTTEGLNKFTVYVENDKGKGANSTIVKYVGYDQPLAPTDVKFDIDANRKATITWTAPTQGIHKGYLGTLKYEVYRLKGKDTTKVTTVNETKFTEILPDGKLTNYVYGVKAVNTTQISAMALSNGKVVGQAIEPPFFEDFTNDLSIFSVIDANNDGKTWGWGGDKKAARYNYNAKEQADDWLVTPPLKLKGGKKYVLTYKACPALKSFPETFEVKMGKEAKVAALTTELQAKVTLDKAGYQEFTNTVAPTADGEYYIGFHAISEANRFYLYIDSISIESSAEATAPAAASNLKVTIDPTGALKSTVEFVAPTKTVDGKTLTAIDKIVLKRDGEIIKTYNNPAPGSKQSFADNSPKQGINIYTVIASNASGDGEKAEIKAYVGEDIPAAPDVEAVDNVTSVVLKWKPVKGKNNGIIIPADVRYDIFGVTDDGYVGDSISSVQGGTSYTVTGQQTDKGKQGYLQWALRAVNKAGASEWAAGGLLGGEPYKMPYKMSFKGKTLEDKFMGMERSVNTLNCGLLEQAQDGDGGCAAFQGTSAGTISVVLGKFNFAGVKAAKMMFFYKTPANVPAKLQVNIEQKDGTVKKLWEEDLASNTKDGWKLADVEIPSEFYHDSYDILKITVVFGNGITQSDLVMIDNINVVDPVQKDAAIELVAPESVKKGQTVNMTAKVSNLGADDVAGAKLTVTVNGKEVVKDQAIETIKTMEKLEIPVSFKSTTLDKSKTLEVEAKVAFEGDLKADNNVAKASIKATDAKVATPTDLTAKVNGNKVELAWKAPENSVSAITDDFENYDAWSIAFGDWTTIDADEGLAAGIAKGAQYQHQGEKFAFINWQPADLFKTGQGLDPHSGTKALVAIYQLDATGKNFVDCDNWLVTPRLSGNAQTIKFWVNNVLGDGYGKEQFEVLTSTTGNDKAKFIKLGETYKQESGQWTEISVTVPAGTNYLAIRHTTNANQSFIFMIDDVTYEAGTAPIGYNIYRDEAFIKNVNATSYVDDVVGTLYKVTAVYNGNIESAPIEAKTSDVVSIEASKAKSHNVYTIDGRQMLQDANTTQGLEPGIYIIDGKKTVIRKK